VLLRRLPVQEPERIALLTMVGSHYGNNWGGNAISYPLYEDLTRNNQVFSGMFCRFPTSVSLSFGGQTERVSAELVSGTYFPVLGVGAVLGRTFTPEEDQTPGGHPLVVLSHAYWRTRFAADPSVVGKTLILNGHNMTVLGVAAAGFDGVQLEFVPQVFVPMMMKAQMTPLWDALKDRRSRFVNAFGRLKPGVTLAQAKASLQPFFKGVLEMEVEEAAFRNASVEAREAFLRNVLDVLPGGQGRSYLRRQLETPLLLLMGLTGGVLLIACANVANLLIARAAARDKEIAVRLALGATRRRIVRLLLVESLVLAVLGAIAGAGMAYATDRMVFGLLPPDAASLKLSPAPDLRILLFTAAVAIVTALVFGLAPALQSTRPDLAPTLKDQAGALAGGARQARFRKALVAAQVALSLLLLVGAGLFVRSLMNLRRLGPGFPTERLLAFNLDPSLNAYKVDQSKAFYKQLTEELGGLPGVKAVGAASVGILQDNEWDSGVTVEGHLRAPQENTQAYMNSIGPGYFAALDVPVVAGRDFTVQDTAQVKHGSGDDDFTPRVVIVNEKFARRFFGEASPLGRHVGFGSDPGTPTDMEIVGVIKDIKYTTLRDEIPIQMFIPYLASRFVGDMTVYVRTTLAPEALVSLARDRVRKLDPHLPLYGVRTMEQRVTDRRALRVLRAPGHRARERGPLRRHGLQRRSPHPGDRNPHGPGRVRGGRRLAGPARGPAPGGNRPRGRPSRGPRPRAVRAEPALRGALRRPLHPRPRGPEPGPGGGPGRLHSRPAGQPGGSHPRAALRIGPQPRAARIRSWASAGRASPRASALPFGLILLFQVFRRTSITLSRGCSRTNSPSSVSRNTRQAASSMAWASGSSGGAVLATSRATRSARAGSPPAPATSSRARRP
ncbi:MAG: FtsX-like permease family protein, partial [Chloroflexi bacterium]